MGPGVVALLVFLGAPIAFVLLLAALVYYLLSPQPAMIVAQQVITGLESFPLLAVPFFVLAGSAMARGGLARELLDFANLLVGRRRGGLAQVNVLNSVMMGGMSGSAIADGAVDAKVLVPVMVRHGYTRVFSSALSAATGVIAPIIPPGIGMIIYGLVAQVSVGHLFVGGIVPGLLLAVALMITVSIIARRRGYGTSLDHRPSASEILKAGRRALPALLMPVLLIVGLRAGVFTPTELGAIAAIYTLLVGAFVYRQITVRNIGEVLRDAVFATAVVMFMLAAGSGLGAVFTLEQIPQTLAGLLLGVSDNPWVVLIVINVLLLVLGMVIDATTLTIILAPILATAAVGLGVDPIHFGVVMVVNLTIGGITPPLGVVIFTVVGITKADLTQTFREILPFVAACVVVLFLITFIPDLVLWLPNFLLG
ncbi:TRAP transporter large permease [Spiractinospora alimapuensis]|uniref:TRAP transporter large permease n=1 Tax=Spiractinospora alimapuensis TaxID=2820884 RepID=UPI001F19C134|nr:TRAP transporter large permease [Spiractinospora alimapuensis]QVQ53798.1 TRAP transporter large permease [Spiractinospora alimapuensis]